MGSPSSYEKVRNTLNSFKLGLNGLSTVRPRAHRHRDFSLNPLTRKWHLSAIVHRHGFPGRRGSGALVPLHTSRYGIEHIVHRSGKGTLTATSRPAPHILGGWATVDSIH